MKRVLVATVAGLMAASAAFAGEISVKGTYTDSIPFGGVGTDGKGLSKAYTYTKGRIDFKVKANDQTSFLVESKLESNMAIDYVYADVAMDAYKLRVGTITDGTSGYTGGIYQSPCFQALSRTKGNGAQVSTKLGDVNVLLSNIGAALNDDSVKVYALKADTKIDNASIGAVVKTAAAATTAGDNKMGYSAEVEGAYTMGDAKISAQYYMDLNDNAPNLFNYGAAASSVVGVNKAVLKKESWLGLFGEYNLAGLTGVGGLGVYADYVMAMNDDTKTQWCATYKTKAEQGALSANIAGKATNGTSSRMAIGAKCDLNEVSTVFYEMVSTSPKDGDAVGSSSLGLQVKF